MPTGSARAPRRSASRLLSHPNGSRRSARCESIFKRQKASWQPNSSEPGLRVPYGGAVETEGFVEALLAAPIGVTLLGRLERNLKLPQSVEIRIIIHSTTGLPIVQSQMMMVRCGRNEQSRICHPIFNVKPKQIDIEMLRNRHITHPQVDVAHISIGI